jgi:hypothetical protein
MVTKGTFKDSNSQGYESRYVMSFKRTNLYGKMQIGVTFFDVSTLRIYMG